MTKIQGLKIVGTGLSRKRAPMWLKLHQSASAMASVDFRRCDWKSLPGLGALILLFAHAASAGSSITALGDLPGGAVSSTAYGVSNDGQIVVGESSSSVSSTAEAFKWTAAGGMVGLGLLPGGTTSSARAISRDGTTIVGSATSTAAASGGGTEGFRRVAGVMAGLHVPQILDQATAVSADGNTVVGSNSSLRWTSANGVQQNIVPYGSFGISDDASVVVGRSSGFRAQRWTAATGVVDLPDTDGVGVFSVAYGVSGDGRVAVGNRNNVACYWTVGGGRVSIGPAGTVSTALAVNFDGSIIVGRANSLATGATEAFVWTSAGGLRTLSSILIAQGVSLSHWKSAVLTELTGISDDGQYLVGNAANSSNKNEGFLVQLLLPPTLSLVEQWRMAYFGTSADVGNGADLADPDLDGLPNLLEYALGTDPLVATAPGSFSLTHVGGQFQFNLTRIADPALTYTVEASDTLPNIPWDPVWTSTGPANTAGQVTVPESAFAPGHAMRFLRLKVSR